LTLINYINLHPEETVLPAVAITPQQYYDVNNDQACTSLDVVAVVNHLNAEASLVAEGESCRLFPAPIVAAAEPTSDNHRDRFFRDLEMELSPREDLFGDLADDIASGWRSPG
jgi:hypothetical protein